MELDGAGYVCVLVHNADYDKGRNYENRESLSEWLENNSDLLDETRNMYSNSPEWFGINPDNIQIYYRTPDEVALIR